MIFIPPKKKKSCKEVIFSKVQGFEVKESDNDELVRGGYIATTHLDSGFYDFERDIYIRDQISKDTLNVWATEINDGVPRANKVSVNHDREPHVTGVGVKGSARVDDLGDGHFGLYVDTLVDKTKGTFDDTKYKIDNGFIDSFSIEFITRDPGSDEYITGAVTEIETNYGLQRTLMPETQLHGWTLASQPMNEHAIMIKEIGKTEGYTMETKDETKPEEVPKQPAEEPVKEETPVEEPKEEEAPVEEKKELSEEDAKLLKETKENIVKEAKMKELKEIKEEIMKEIKEELKATKVEAKVQKNADDKVEIKEVVDYKAMLTSEKPVGIDLQFKMAGLAAEKLGLVSAKGMKPDSETIFTREYKMQTNGNKMEMKGLGITTNQNTDTSYLLSAAELADVFDPVIYNALNQATATWNILMKDDLSNKGNNQVQFTLKTAANTTAAAYTGNAVALGNVKRLKYMTKFKKYQVGVEIDGDMIAAARGGPIGDVFAREVQDSTDDLMAVINAALYAEVGAETAAGIIGFEYITDSANNTSLYSLTRSSANKLSPDSASDTYIDSSSATISLTNLRAAIRQCTTDGSNRANLVFFASPTQIDMFKSIYDAAQRLVPTSSRFGFEGRPEFDGVPIFEDKDCNTDDWFLVDLDAHRVGIWVPPTLEVLGKDSDSVKGFIKTYFATYNRAPRRMVQIYDNATS